MILEVYAFGCEECPAYIVVPSYTLASAENSLRKMGWHVTMNPYRAIKHYCPSCHTELKENK